MKTTTKSVIVLEHDNGQCEETTVEFGPDMEHVIVTQGDNTISICPDNWNQILGHVDAHVNTIRKRKMAESPSE